MIPTLIQLTPNQQAVRDYFQEGGSFTAVAVVLLVLVGVFLLTYLIMRRQERASAETLRDDPPDLFRSLLRRLELSSAQRNLLMTVAKGLDLTNPTVLLLSPKLFRQHVSRWGQQSSIQIEEQLIESTEKVLFPGQVGLAKSRGRT
jgi:type II secretory pathway component PulF